MIDMDSPFSIEQGSQSLHIRPRKVGGAIVFVVHFADQRLPLAITKASAENLPVFWTSIPEGRQNEAEQIGPLISAHYQQLATR